MRLKDQVIVVTGAGRGIGEAIAARCAAEGARVVLWDVLQDAAEAAAARIATASPGARVVPCAVNVADSAGVAEAAGLVLARHGRIDGLVNNAGIIRDAQLHKMSLEQWDQVIAVNLSGVFHATRAFAPQFVEQKSGAIVNISSIVGLYGNFGQTNYAAAKAGVIGMTRTWARELGRKGVRANAICPGFVATPILDTMPEKLIAAMQDEVPLGRMGRPEEVAAACAFLLSDEASYINGVALEVAGGLTL